MRNFTDGVFAIGLFLGIVVAVAIGPVIGLLNWHKVSISFDAMFSSAAGALAAVLAGVWLFNRSRAIAHDDELRRSAKVVRLYIAASASAIAVFRKHAETHIQKWNDNEAALHPLIMMHHPYISARAAPLPFESVSRLTNAVHHDIVIHMISLAGKSEAFNKTMEGLIEHRARLLDNHATKPIPIGSGYARIPEASVESWNTNAGYLTKDMVLLVQQADDLLETYQHIKGAMAVIER